MRFIVLGFRFQVSLLRAFTHLSNKDWGSEGLQCEVYGFPVEIFLRRVGF